ncbi:hypothetical protein PILCRDRAFT_87885 [Piloderma croceum F 1598]|uniref:Uncharacterized protein n=1 Tax=Piloderma croceum (strain F 1598) TaxID=765440 RepID=A0A0C3FHQ9_PILCF|nr:hypothetical protein PILCRDRAFT_87885 [Piloderma croceum F 1598]
MGPPYASIHVIIGPGPSLTFQNCGKTYKTYADLCAYSDYLVSDMPVESWPRDDAEAKLIAAAIATYNFNNYEVPKRYHELDADDKQEVDPFFVVHDPSFLAGMTWEGTRPSFYKLSIGSDLVKAVRVGTYPRVPTRVYKYTPVFPEKPEGGMDKLWMR